MGKNFIMFLLGFTLLMGCQNAPKAPDSPSVPPVVENPEIPPVTPPAQDEIVVDQIPLLGYKGDNVLKLQKQMVSKCGAQLTPEGNFGPLTQAGVKLCQKTFKMKETGVVDEALLTALGITLRLKPITGLDTIYQIAETSTCSKTVWNDRGRARVGYYKGMAATFAKQVCQQDRADVVVVSQKNRNDGVKDVATHYKQIFDSLDMSNEKSGVDTLRHIWTLLIGLGMRESSGNYCCGPEGRPEFSTVDSCEAGPFQTSWGSKRVSTTLVALMKEYQDGKYDCQLDTFKAGVPQSYCDGQNGICGKSSEDGYKWQALTRKCPAFAAEWAAVLLRLTGGSVGEFGPIRKHQAQVIPACHSMLSAVQAEVEAHPSICQSFLK